MKCLDYWWTKLRLLATNFAVRLTKKQMLSSVYDSRRTTAQMDDAYRRFIAVSVRQAELAVHLKSLSDQNGQYPLLGMRFGIGEVTVSPPAKTIPLYDRKLAMVRHQNGDWGNISEYEWTENNRNLQNSCGVVRSKYLSGSHRLFRIETDLATSKTNIRWECEMNEPDDPNQKTDGAATECRR